MAQNSYTKQKTLLCLTILTPKAPVHMLVCPKEHIASLNELEDPKLMAELLQTVKDVTKSWIKIIQNTNQHRKRSRSRSFHLHIHVMGKFKKQIF